MGWGSNATLRKSHWKRECLWRWCVRRWKCVYVCVCESSRTCRVVPVPPGSVCCWPTEATSAGLDSPCGVRSIEARWLASCLTRGAQGERPHSTGVYPMVVCVCVGACERGPYPSGHGEQSRALSNHSLLSKASQEGKGGGGGRSCETVPIKSLCFQSQSQGHLQWWCYEMRAD